MCKRLVLVLFVVATVVVALAGNLSAADKPLDPAAPQLGAAPSVDKPPGEGGEGGEFGPSAVALRYAFSQGSGTYTEITGGTQLTTLLRRHQLQRQQHRLHLHLRRHRLHPVSVQCNGFLRHGRDRLQLATPRSAAATSNNVIAALGGDLQTNRPTPRSATRLLGTAPDQVFVVQWKNFRPLHRRRATSSTSRSACTRPATGSRSSTATSPRTRLPGQGRSACAAPAPPTSTTARRPAAATGSASVPGASNYGHA